MPCPLRGVRVQRSVGKYKDHTCVTRSPCIVQILQVIVTTSSLANCGSSDTVCSCSYNPLHGYFTSNIPQHYVGIGIQCSGVSPLPPNWRKIWRRSPGWRWTTGESEWELTKPASIWLCTSSIYQRKLTFLWNALAWFPGHMGMRLVMLQSCSHSVCIMQNFVQF